MFTAPLRILLICLLISLIFPNQQARAQAGHWHSDKNHWKLHWQHRNFNDDAEYDHRAEGCYFEPRDVWAASDYFRERYRPLPPGTAGKYYKTGYLPAGWKGQIAALPVKLETRMATLDDGLRRAVVGGSLIVYDPQEQVILDTIVLFGR